MTANRGNDPGTPGSSASRTPGRDLGSGLVPEGPKGIPWGVALTDLSWVAGTGSKLALFYFALCLPLAVLLWDHGHHPTDDGFILAYAWRVHNGSVPYRDFLYPWPPLSPWLHSLWFELPSTWSFSAARLGYFFQMGVSLWALTYAAVSVRALRPSLAVLSGAGVFLYASFHDFPAMPWYTVDGVFFSSIGTALFLFARGRSVWFRAASGACFGLAALCKQNFAALYALFVLLSVAEACFRPSRAKWKKVFLSCSVSFVPIAFSLLWLWRQGALAPLLRQLATFTSARALEQAGWESYVSSLKPFSPYFFIGLSALFFRPRREGLYGWVILISLAAIFCAAKAIGEPWWGFQLFWLGLGIGAANVRRALSEESEATVQWALFSVLALALAWVSSISIGWRTPLLGIGATGLVVAEVLQSARPAAVAALCVFSLVTVGKLQWGGYYRDGHRAGQTENLASVYGRFGTLHTSPLTFARYRDLKAISEKLAAQNETDTVVYPEFPLYYFLENRTNPTGLDWWAPHHIAGYEKDLLEGFRRTRPAVLIEVDPSAPECLPTQDDFLSRWVRRNGTLVARSQYFCAYSLRARP
jgi:hypothetical protein